MSVATKIIVELRQKTGAGFTNCQKALQESNGDLEKAVEILRKKGEKVVNDKAVRVTNEGLIQAYIHADGKVGVLIEVNCETDFVARNEEFKELVHDLALQIAAMDPRYVSLEEVPAVEIEKEKEVYREQLKKENRSAPVLEKIIEGKLAKFYEEVCLTQQFFIKDEKMRIEDLLKEKITKLGENIKIKRFVRYQL